MCNLISLLLGGHVELELSEGRLRLKVHGAQFLHLYLLPAHTAQILYLTFRADNGSIFNNDLEKKIYMYISLAIF